MDKQLKILLNSEQNIESVNVDMFDKIELKRLPKEITEYNIRNVVNATEVFDAEREANEIYRLYGKIEYLSLLNGLKLDYSEFSDFFNPQNDNVKNIFNSFDFYLVRPASSGYTDSVISNSGIIIDEDFNNWITSTPSNYPIGWNVSVSTNSFMRQTLTNQAEFVLDNQYIFTAPFNIISLYKDIPEVYGDLVIKTNVDISSSLNVSSDLFTLTLFSNGTMVGNYQLFTTGVGYKEYHINVPESTPITKVSIFANSSNKSFYMDYLQIEKTDNNIGTTKTDIYNRFFEVIATPKDFELFPIGFSNNVYGEQGYSFNYNVDINISEYYDQFNFPVTDLYLYAQYKKSPNETLLFTNWSISGITQVDLITKELNIGDYVESLNELRIGDLIEYNKSTFLQNQLSEQTYYIITPYSIEGVSSTLKWKYNPFIPITLRNLSDSYYVANTGSTSYELVQSIPNYATDIDDGNFVWRNIMIEDYIDPLTGIGTNHPFINGKRYVFSSFILDVTPDLTDNLTRIAFEDIWFTKNRTKIKTSPTGNINNIGKPCS